MGCASSQIEKESVELPPAVQSKGTKKNDSPTATCFTLEELSAATNGFSEGNIIDGNSQARNVIYKGVLPDGKAIAIKKFQSAVWTDESTFVSEVTKVSKIKFSGWVSLIGYCCEGSNRLLVADFMPNSTLANKLFHWEESPMPWSSRLSVALKLAQVLNHLRNKEGFEIYHDLTIYRILFDLEKEPRLSCFGLLKCNPDEENYSSNLAYVPPEILKTGAKGVTMESIVFCYGTILLALFSGKSIFPNYFLELVERKSSFMVLIDSALIGKSGMGSAMNIIPLVVQCLNPDPKKRPDLTSIISSLNKMDGSESRVSSPLRTNEGSPKQPKIRSPSSPVHQTTPHEKSPIRLSAFANAALLGEFKMLHEMLVKEVYGTPPQEVSFESWNVEMQEKLSARKKGDQSFKGCRWQEAINFYSLFTKLAIAPLPLMFARRCVAYLHLSDWQAALSDAMTAQYAQPNWPEAYFLQVAALKKLGLHEDAEDKLSQGTSLEQQISMELEAEQ